MNVAISAIPIFHILPITGRQFCEDNANQKLQFIFTGKAVNKSLCHQFQRTPSNKGSYIFLSLPFGNGFSSNLS